MNKNECFLGNYLDLTNQRYGRLIVVKLLGQNKHNHYQWECKCDCGNIIMLDTSTLRTGHTKSCGCLRKEYWRDRKRKEPYYWVYNHLLHRCKRGGIKCHLTFDEFREFTSILNCHYCQSPIQWQQYSSDKIHTSKRNSSAYYLDRKDNGHGYAKDNCVVCCPLCNMTKSNNYSYKEMLKLGRIIEQIQKDRAGK